MPHNTIQYNCRVCKEVENAYRHLCAQKVDRIMKKYQKKALKAGADDWQSLLYEDFLKQRGKDPREVWRAHHPTDAGGAHDH